MNTYLSIFVIALVSSLIITPIIRRIAQRRGWFDLPNEKRRLHSRPIPRLGGVAIYFSVLATLAPLPLLDNLLTEAVRPAWQKLFGVFVSATLVFLFGVYDDFKGTKASLKFIALSVGATVLYFSGVSISGVSIPFVGSVHLPPLLGFAFTLLWIVGVSNAFNLIDGMDGLAAGAGLFATLVMLIVSFVQGNVAVAILTLALTGALIGFLRYNFNPASIFLGDCGALFVGFTLASLSILGAQKASTAVAIAIPMMAFGLPIIDLSFTVVRRFISGKPLFQGDREHIHHMLLARGWSQRNVAFALYSLCALFSVLGLLTASEGGGSRITAVTLIVMAAAVVFVGGRLRYPELDEIKAGIKRTVGDRRVRVANHVRVRRACRMLGEAATIGEIFVATHELLKSAEFVYASIELNCRTSTMNWQAVSRAVEKYGAKLRDGVIVWEWERGDVEAHEVVDSNLFWNLRLPLSTGSRDWGAITFYREFGNDELLLDINYLINLVQRELTLAAERVLATELKEPLSLSGERRLAALAAKA